MTGGLNLSLMWLRAIPVLTLLTFVVSTFSWNEGGTEGLGISSTNSTTDFYWIDIEPTHNLIWHKCYEPLQRECARLLVPLNHLNNSTESLAYATIALIRKPSTFASLTHPDDPSKPDPRYRGPIIFNPGGPAASGIGLINRSGDLFAQILGEEFDIVSFDPRGVWRSTPKIMFFGSASNGEREAWTGSNIDVIRRGANVANGIGGENGQSIERTWARAVVTNKLAEERGGEWLGNINTEQTAYDMLSIVKAYGGEKLMYWGFSYGTVLGATFAALFPDKVERMVLDGVANAEDYYATQWSNNLRDTPLTLNKFFEMCHAAGPSSCAFWARSPSLIQANLSRIYDDLIKEPIPIRTSVSYGVLDYSRVRITVFNALYSPWDAWPALAMALADLGSPSRDPERMWTLNEFPPFSCSKCSLSPNEKKEQLETDFEASLPEAASAIVCTDGANIFPDLLSAKKFFEDFSNKSEWAEVWATVPIGCAGWPKIKKGFQGPVEGKTHFPLLFVGNTADPVTPLSDAKLMSTRFPGSRVLTQDSPGHTSTSGPSVCTQSHIRNYFVSGTLPPEDTVCPVISSPFPGSALPALERTNEAVPANAQETEESLLRNAVTELSRAWGTFNRGFL